MNNKTNPNIVWFKDIGKNDLALVGGKGANLGEMVKIGLPVPNGFVVTASAYFDFIENSGVKPALKELLKQIDREKPQSYLEVSVKIKKIINNCDFPRQLSNDILKAYARLSGVFGESLVAVRSSATAEDLPEASFAGQQRTFLNIKGEVDLVEAVRECFASLFEARAIFYREQNQFDHFSVGVAVPVQKMVQSQTSGVMFTCDPVTSQKNRIIIEAIFGLGEFIVQGTVTPDHYALDSDSFKILDKILAPQKIQYVKSGNINKTVGVPSKWQTKQKLSDSQITELAKIGKKIQKHYFFPQDIEWAIEKEKIYILQTRPVTTIKELKETHFEKTIKEEVKEKVAILEGQAASPGIVTGSVNIINSVREINKIKKGDILVTDMTTPDFVPAMKKAVAIVTNKGGQTSHAAIVSRELGIPCVVGTGSATKTLGKYRFVTVDGTSGKIYKSDFSWAKKTIKEAENKELLSNDKSNRSSVSSQIRTATKIYVNLGDPSLAEEVAQKNVDGVGLLRAEFMMADIGIHPKKMIKDGKKKEYVSQLAEKISSFCAAFYPRPVVYRTTDFKSNEYRNLKGGLDFEPVEPNPMLGFRGASRYIINSEVFEMELEAIKMVRNKLGLKNLWLMLPFVRTPEELAEVKKIIVSAGLLRSPSFKIWLMVEIPANVIRLEDFLKIGIDGISIGSNDLTMLLLGTDRDNSEVANIFNEMDKTVLWALERVIKTCQKEKVTSSICGQAPSEYPDLVELLVRWGITSISVNPDIVDGVRENVYQVENKLLSERRG